MVAAEVTGDAEMFATAVQQTFDDDYGFGGMGSTINALRSMAEDLAGLLIDVHGPDKAAHLLRLLVARYAAQSEQEPDDGNS
ncbi:hypothetical protein D9V29_11800 [Mycetocola manganoxydans]|uniref:Uncharacterized protein n=2 Tax=Mycetocola manganoxydans TaxID=699879 RepID=A0A3L6ZNM6_9MICO|nr:hypothetical protein D9V29_11800 [Mycetocola manganoxydans]GHD50706.1 hypothetical protein GCM10008097_24960 [Mycetocola manganoxydans]